MNLVLIIDLSTFLSVIIALIIVLHGWNSVFSFSTKLILILLLIINMFHGFSNVLEWSNISNALDSYEDYIQILEPVLWFFFLFSFLQEISKKKLIKSKEKYYHAYNKVEFYKDIFAHNVRNILQNMLSSIGLYNEYQKKLEKIEESKEIINIIEEQILRVANLVSNIQKLSTLEEYRPLNQSIDICPILRDSIFYVKNTFHDKEIDISIDSIDKKFYVLANNFLRDVFDNILINAVKFDNNPVKKISIEICKMQKEGTNYLKLKFIDNAIGIIDSRKKSIFQRKFKNERSHSELGLGLTLVNKLIEYFNGYIWVEDKVPGDYSKGSIFNILIPEAL